MDSIVGEVTKAIKPARYGSVLVKMGVAPLFCYLFFFCVLTYPAVTRFSTHYFADGDDGMQNVWNIWWVGKAVTRLHQSPWHTTFLHYPYGITLLGQTLNPFNGFIGILLSPLLNQVAAHNVIVTFSFVVGGLTAFLLAYYLTHSYWPSLVAGYIFTFSPYHFAQAQGHLQLVSLEWIPLFLLLWLILLDKPSIRLAVTASVVLFLVMLCDYYYFFYCVLAGVIICAWYFWQRREELMLLWPRLLKALSIFCLVTVSTSGVLAGALLLSNSRDHLTGAHSTNEFSLDLFAPFIYGGHWRFASLTSAYWSHLPGNIHESCVYLGFAVIVLMTVAWLKARSMGERRLGLMYVLLVFFIVMALGPRLHILRHQISFIPLPYVALVRILPFLRLSGMPVRMMVMVSLSAAVISAFGLRYLMSGSSRTRLAAGILVGALFVEYLPAPIPLSDFPIPEYVRVLKGLPGSEGVLDTVSLPTLSLLYQTVHEKPLAFGYVSRLPESVAAQDADVVSLVKLDDYEHLYSKYHFRYVITKDANHRLRNVAHAKATVWTDGAVWLFDLSHVEWGPGGSGSNPGP